MAPEVINRKQYDASADIWSFGITALELAQGRAPRSREPPHSVLLHIVTNTPPVLDRDAGPHKYSRAFQEIIERCLNKDPSRRPTAAELLQTPFFRNAKKKGYLVGTILKGLPPLAQRQERRKQPSIISPRTLDSWDFGTIATSGSPTASLLYRSTTMHPFEVPLSETEPEGVFELEAEGESVEKADQQEQEQDKKGKCGVAANGDTTENGERAGGATTDSDREQIRGHRITSQHAPRPHSVGPTQGADSQEERRSERSHSRGVSWADGGQDEGKVESEAVGEGEVLAPPAVVEKQPSASTTASTATVGSAQANPDSGSRPTNGTSPGPLPVPRTRKPSSSPQSSPRSSPSTPPSSNKLWRRLTGIASSRPDDSSSAESGSGSGSESIRKRVLSGVLGAGRRVVSSSPGSD